MPTSIDVTPDPATTDVGGQVQFQALAHFDSMPDYYVTAYCAWGSSDTSVATINSGLPSGTAMNAGKALGRTEGSTVISCSMASSEGTFTADPVDLYVGEAPPDLVSETRFALAFDSLTLDPDPEWTPIDTHPNLVSSYTIDRGRQYELDRTDTGRATVTIADTAGLLDPTNPDGPYYGKIQPLIQACVARYNPVADEWQMRFRGFVDGYDYIVDPTQKVNHLAISLVDLMEIVSAVELWCGQFGDLKELLSDPATELAPDSVFDPRGMVYYDVSHVDHRIEHILTDCGIPSRFWALMPGHVTVGGGLFSNGESALTALTHAADSELPAVSTIFCDRKGRIAFRDRDSKFDAAAAAADVGADVWDYHAWQVGDGAAVAADGTHQTVQVRELGFQRTLDKIINSAASTPPYPPDNNPVTLVIDPVSIGKYGIRSWSADGIGTMFDDGGGGYPTVHLRIGHFYVDNYNEPHDRIAAIGFRSLHPSDPRGPVLWEFLSKVDIGDMVTVTVAAPGGGGFTSEQWFVEGIHEEARPLQPMFDDVTVRLDLSPKPTSNPFPEAAGLRVERRQPLTVTDGRLPVFLAGPDGVIVRAEETAGAATP